MLRVHPVRFVRRNAAGLPRCQGPRRQPEAVVRVQWPEHRRLQLHIRQLGFKPVDRIVDADRDSSYRDSLTVVLERVAFALPPIVTREVEMDFSPANGTHDPEWQGTAFIDSATSVLTRVKFRLEGLPDDEIPGDSRGTPRSCRRRHTTPFPTRSSPTGGGAAHPR